MTAIEVTLIRRDVMMTAVNSGIHSIRARIIFAGAKGRQC